MFRGLREDRFSLKTETLGYAGFEDSSFGIIAPPTTERWTATIPILLSKDVRMVDFAIVLPEEVRKSINAKLELKEGVEVVSLDFDVQFCVKIESVDLTLVPKSTRSSQSKESGSDMNQTCRLSFSIAKPIEVLPRDMRRGVQRTKSF